MTHTRLALIAVACFALVGPFVVTDYGITWDEKVQREYGQMCVDYYASLGRERAFLEYRDLRFHGPLFELLPESINRITGDRWPYEVRHACTFLAAVLALLGLIAVGRRLGLEGGLPLAVLALLLMPRFVGHAFNNTKDIPFLAAWVWTVWGLLRAIDSDRLRPVALAGVLVGCALAIRIAATMLVLLCAIALFASAFRKDREDGPQRAVQRLALFGVCGWAAMLVGWPFAQLSPIKHPLLTVLDVVHLKTVIPVTFAGSEYVSDQLPRYYPGAFLCIGTPLPILLLAAGGLVVAARERTLGWAVVVGWLALPQLVFAAMGNNVYDGLRHFLFLTPAVALLAGLGAQAVLKRFPGRPAQVVLTLALAWGLVPIVQLHPYQHAYFNATVGGVAGADGRYETEYYASSYRETALWLRAEAARRGATKERPLRVLAASNEYIHICLTYYLDGAPVEARSLLEEGEGPHDLFVALRRFGWDRIETFREGYETVHRIGRGGATFVVIREKR